MENNRVDDIKIVTQILYKKYCKLYSWLAYNDLYLIITKIKDKYVDILFLSSNMGPNLNRATIKIFADKLFPFLDKIDEKKSLRNIEEEEEKDLVKQKPQIVEKKIVEDLFADTNVPMQEVLNYKSYSIFLDSFDRNKSAWESINPFSFPMGYDFSIENEYEKSDKTADKYGGSVSRTFSNVENIEINKIILPSIDSEGNDISLKYPYIIFSIDEIEKRIKGTNNHLSRSFEQLLCPGKSGDYLYYNDNFLMNFSFIPRIEISKMTFTFKTPTGDVIIFPSEEEKSVRICVGLTIKCLNKSLTTKFFNRPI
jgi:hypothetical protein